VIFSSNIMISGEIYHIFIAHGTLHYYSIVWAHHFDDQKSSSFIIDGVNIWVGVVQYEEFIAMNSHVWENG